MKNKKKSTIKLVIIMVVSFIIILTGTILYCFEGPLVALGFNPFPLFVISLVCGIVVIIFCFTAYTIGD